MLTTEELTRWEREAEFGCALGLTSSHRILDLIKEVRRQRADLVLQDEQLLHLRGQLEAVQRHWAHAHCPLREDGHE